MYMHAQFKKKPQIYPLIKPIWISYVLLWIKEENLVTYSTTEQIYYVRIEVNKSLRAIRIINCALRFCKKKKEEKK